MYHLAGWSVTIWWQQWEWDLGFLCLGDGGSCTIWLDGLLQFGGSSGVLDFYVWGMEVDVQQLECRFFFLGKSNVMNHECCNITPGT